MQTAPQNTQQRNKKMNKILVTIFMLSSIATAECRLPNTYNIDGKGNVSTGAPKNLREPESRKTDRYEITDTDPRQTFFIRK